VAEWPDCRPWAWWRYTAQESRRVLEGEAHRVPGTGDGWWRGAFVLGREILVRDPGLLARHEQAQPLEVCGLTLDPRSPRVRRQRQKEAHSYNADGSVLSVLLRSRDDQ